MGETAALVSVVIPAYNAEKFLLRCINSVREQTLSDWEVLVVENGSTDGTTALGEQLEQTDHRIRLLHSDKGVSRARNTGITAATGEYLFFLDADDWLLPDTLEFLVNTARANAGCDIVVGATDRVTDTGVVRRIDREGMAGALAEFLRQPTRYLPAWGKLYRTAFVRESGVRFNPALTHAEDSDFVIHVMGHCGGVVITDHPVYHYSITATSAVHGGQAGMEEKYRTSLEITATDLPFGAEVAQAYNFYILDNLLVLLVHDTFRPGRPAKEQRRLAAAVLALPVFRNALLQAPLSEAGGVKGIVYRLAKGGHLRLLQLAVWVRQWQNKRHQEE